MLIRTAAANPVRLLQTSVPKRYATMQVPAANSGAVKTHTCRSATVKVNACATLYREAAVHIKPAQSKESVMHIQWAGRRKLTRIHCAANDTSKWVPAFTVKPITEII